MSRIPRLFAGLHAHDAGSSFDGLSSADQHIDFVIENGMDALAITNHGHCNTFPIAREHVMKLATKGINFKYIPGFESYIHPDLREWEKDATKSREDKENAKIEKKRAKEAKEKVVTPLEVTTDGDGEVIDVTNALTIENEEESKSNKFFQPINRRHHLVVLPKTSAALLKVFHLVSRGYLEGFYRFPRIDYSMLKEAARDRDIIVSTACLAGINSFCTMRELQGIAFEKLDASLLDDRGLMNNVLRSFSNEFDKLADAVGPENVMLELQFNKLPAQHLVNRSMLEFARRNGMTKQLIVTADSHYARPEHWKEREIYKKLGWLNYTEINPDALPKSRDELKCELYPKNATQIWKEYTDAKEAGHTFYNDDEVCDAIERTHDIAHNVIGDIQYDTGIKLPSFAVPAGKTPLRALMDECRLGLKKRGLDGKPEYAARLKEELEVIRDMKFELYFLTLKVILDIAREEMLIGPGRGSGAGSLVNYLLDITDVDPIKWGLLFSRFLNRDRCLRGSTQVLTPSGMKKIEDIRVGDVVWSGKETQKKITATISSKHKKTVKLKVGTQTFICSPMHKWLIKGPAGNPIEKLACELSVTDHLYMYLHGFTTVQITSIENIDNEEELFDITVEGDHTFLVSEDGRDFFLTHNSEAPDIDTDVGNRDRLIEMLRERLGTDNVIPISNINSFALKTLVKDVSRFYGVPYEDAMLATKTVDEDVKKAVLKHGMDKNLFVLKYEDALLHSPNFKDFIDKHPEVAEPIAVLFKQPKALGRHAGGVIVTDNIAQRMPLITSKGEAQSPWCEGLLRKDLGVLGWVKFDLLGLETLRIIQRTIELVLTRHGGIKNPTFDNVKDWYAKYLAPDTADFDDQHVYENVYHQGKWSGVFQCLDELTLVKMESGVQKPISEITVGEKVISKTSDSWTISSVDEVFDNGYQNCIELEFDDETKLVCTPDHQILTQRGWVEAQELSRDDDIVSFR